MADCTTVMVVACQVDPFYLALTQINSEMNCLAKNKYHESQKLDTRRRSENFDRDITTCHEEQQHSMYSLCQGVLHSLSLYYSI